MIRAEALRFVNTEIERIECENAGKELRPWELDACPAARQHWTRVQQRIWLVSGGQRGPTNCCAELGIEWKPIANAKVGQFPPQER